MLKNVVQCCGGEGSDGVGRGGGGVDGSGGGGIGGNGGGGDGGVSASWLLLLQTPWVTM